MIDLTKKPIVQRIKILLIVVNVAVLLIANFALSSLSAEALPGGTNLSRVYQGIGNSDNEILIAEHSSNKRKSTREKHQKGEARRKKDQENSDFKKQKNKNKNKNKNKKLTKSLFDKKNK